MAKQNNVDIQEEDIVTNELHQDVVDAFDYFLSGREQGVVDSIIRDLSPTIEIDTDKNGEEKVITKPPRGLSIGSVFRVIGLLFSQPTHTFTMIKFALNPKKYNTPATHRAILKNKNTWKFVQDTGTKLDKFGAVLGSMGIPEFQEGGILDQKSLLLLKDVFKDPNNLQDLKNTALAARADKVDGIKVAGHLLEMLARDKRFEAYFVDKGLNLQSFIIKTAIEKIESDTRDIIAKGGDLSESIEAKMASIALTPKDIAPLTDIVPILISKPVLLRDVVKHLSKGEYPEMVKVLLSGVENNPEINQYLKDNQKLIVGVLDQVIKQVPALEGYDLKGDLYDIVPALLDHPDDLIAMIDCQQKFQFEKAGQIFFGLVSSDQNIKGFFTKHQSVFAGAAFKAAGLKNYKIGDEVGEILSHLMNDKNASKMQKLTERFRNEEWLDMAKDLCSMIAQDPEFNQYVKDNKKNFSKIVKVVLDKLPEAREITGGTKVSKLAGLIISDPQSALELIEGIEQGKLKGAYATAQFVMKQVMNPEVRGAVSEAVTGWFAGRDELQQEVVSEITNMLSSRDMKQKVNLTSFIQSVYDEIAKDVDSETKQKLQKQILRKKFFEKAAITGKRFDKLNMSNLEIDGNQFVNAKIEHVTFENSSITGASFHGAKFYDVQFSGAEIDGYTLESMLPSVRRGDITLEGIKLIGKLGKPKQAIVQQDLTNMSLKGVDFSEVSSYRGVRFGGSDLREAILPDDPLLLVDAYGLEEAQFPEGYITKEVLEKNADRIIEKASDTIINRANGKGDYLTPEQEQGFRDAVDRLYNMNNIIGAKFRQSLHEDPPSMNKYSVRIPMQTHGHKNISDYQGTTLNTLVTLYENKRNYGDLETIFVAHHIADDISRTLFKEGNNRGADGVAIRNGIKEAVDKYLEQNESIDPMSLIENEEYQETIHLLSKDVLKKAYPTFVGKIENIVTLGNSKRIQLEDGAFDKDLVETLKRTMNASAGFVKLNKEESKLIEEMSDIIGKNLFGSGAAGRRAADVKLISNAIYDSVYEIKVKNNAPDIAKILQDNKDEIAGKVNSGWVFKDRTGLTKIFYDASKNTKTNLSTLGLMGGIRLDEKTMTSNDFINSVNEHIEDLISDSLIEKNIAEKNQDEKNKIIDQVKTERKSSMVADNIVSEKSRTKLDLEELKSKKPGSHVEAIKKQSEGKVKSR